MVRVDNRVSVAHVAATLAVSSLVCRVKSGRAVHRCRRSACLSRRCAGLCIVVVAVLAAAADAAGLRIVVAEVLTAAANAVLVVYQVHPATWAV